MICLNMIVRDEAASLHQNLKSVVENAPLSYWVVHDTGSKDSTPHIVQSFFSQHNIRGELHHRKWENFGKNRQMALLDAEGKAPFAMFLDADCLISGKLPPLDPAVDSYMILSHRNGTSYPTKQLIRNNGTFRWRGVVHEGLYFNSNNERCELLEGVRIENRSCGARSRDEATYYRDARLLAKEISDLPKGDEDLLPRYLFYCGNSWRDAGCPREAVYWYKKRIDAGGWRDEVYLSYLNLGIELAKINDYDAAFLAWNEGTEICPDRAECFYKLAQLERERKRFNSAIVFARSAMKMPEPYSDRLFVWRDVYRYWALFEFLWSTKNLGRLDEHDKEIQLFRSRGAPTHLFQIIGII